ncbi:MAG: hypothetical protein F6K59_28305 [Moorea sp. SIO3F7]|nr:hypothetical protein [Moorena sp. SIO3F7]
MQLPAMCRVNRRSRYAVSTERQRTSQQKLVWLTPPKLKTLIKALIKAG